MKIIDGKKIAQKILKELKKEIRDNNFNPKLAVILVGGDQSSKIYVGVKERKGEEIGINVEKHILPEEVSDQDLINLIHSLNENNSVNGILIQLPLPQNLSTDKIIKEINVKKDVDGFLPRTEFNSPFILAIDKAIISTKEDLNDKKILALIKSDIFGKSLLEYFLKNKKVKVECIKEINKDKIKQADILITALGKPEIINRDMIKNGVILIDGGINIKNGKIVGDIDFESVKDKVNWITPVPGGLGPLTVAFLLKNVVLANKL